MKMLLSNDEIAKLKTFLAANEDCELLTGGEWVADIYETDTPVTVNLTIVKDGAEIDGAEYLSYDEESDGWYMSAPVESVETLKKIFSEAGAFA